ncbi:MAG: hypothetical protein HY527_21430 [Betaproteobacteria bacterium]|nr:hypothetical protein [Betaproteobacteria bacterium]
MHPLLVEMSHRFDRLKSRLEIVNAIGELEDAYDSFSEIEQETVSRLIEELNRRLKTAPP